MTAQCSRNTTMQTSVKQAASAADREEDHVLRRRRTDCGITAQQQMNRVMVSRNNMVSLSRHSSTANREVDPLVDRASATVTHLPDAGVTSSQESYERHTAEAAPLQKPDDSSRPEADTEATVPVSSPLALSEDARREAEQVLEEHFNELGRTTFLAEKFPVNGRRQRPMQAWSGMIATGAEHAAGLRFRYGLEAFARLMNEQWNAS
jgi:hypothetical protein